MTETRVESVAVEESLITGIYKCNIIRTIGFLYVITIAIIIIGIKQR